MALTTVARDGSNPQTVADVPRGHSWQSPRWSPDDTWLAFHGRGTTVWDEVLWVVPARGGNRLAIARAMFLRGVSWLPDGAGLVYSSSKESALCPYPPTFNLRVVNRDADRRTRRSRPVTCPSSSPTCMRPADWWPVVFEASLTSGSAR